MSDDVSGYGGPTPPVPEAELAPPVAPSAFQRPTDAAPAGSFQPEPPPSAAPSGSFLPEPPAAPAPAAPTPVAAFPPPAADPVDPGSAPPPPADTTWAPYDAAAAAAPAALGDLEVLPSSHAAPTSRRPGRTAVIATLAVLALLVVGGGAYGWTLLHRPDVQLARAFDATRSQPAGGMTVSMRVAGAGSEAAAQMLTNSSVHYAWGPNTQQVLVTFQGKQLADVVTTPTHLTLQLALAEIPGTAAAQRQLHTIATTMGAQGQPLADLADGKPIGLAIGPGSDVQKLIDKAQADQGMQSQAAVTEKAAAFADAMSKVVRDNTTVTQSGSDANGDHFVASIALTPLLTSLQSELAKVYPGSSPLSGKDLSAIQGKSLSADVWVRDGQVSRIEIPLASLADAPSGAEATVIVVMDGNGVTPPTGPVTEVPSSLLQSLLDPMSG